MINNKKEIKKRSRAAVEKKNSENVRRSFNCINIRDEEMKRGFAETPTSRVMYGKSSHQFLRFHIKNRIPS
jgi:hypothetical protein